MREFLQTAMVQYVLAAAVIAMMVAVGYYIVGKVRDQAIDDSLSTHDLLTGFRDLHQEGSLSEAEFKEIRSVLGKKVQAELIEEGQEEKSLSISDDVRES